MLRIWFFVRSNHRPGNSMESELTNDDVEKEDASAVVGERAPEFGERAP